MRKVSEKESRTLAKYIKAKLGIKLSEFSELEDTPVSTLNDRWKSPSGKIRMIESVFNRYVRMFDDL